MSRDTEVSEPWFAVLAHKDVSGLNIAMQNTRAMSCLDRAGNLNSSS